MLHRQAASGKTRGGSLCIFVNNSWCTFVNSWCTSNIKEVLRFHLPEVEYLMISCRPHYLPREFSSIFFVAVYLPPQTNAGTKTALNELYKAISKQENTHPEPALLVAREFNAGDRKSILPHFYQQVKYATRGKNSRLRSLQTQTCTKLSLTLHLANLTIILYSCFRHTSKN
jgi:hypothetical protein